MRRQKMKRKKMRSILLSAFMLVGALSAPWAAAAQDTGHVKTQRLIDSVHVRMSSMRVLSFGCVSVRGTVSRVGTVLLGQGEPLLHGLDLHALGFMFPASNIF